MKIYFYLFKCYCIMYIISIRPTQPCFGWVGLVYCSGNGCGYSMCVCPSMYSS